METTNSVFGPGRGGGGLKGGVITVCCAAAVCADTGVGNRRGAIGAYHRRDMKNRRYNASRVCMI